MAKKQPTEGQVKARVLVDGQFGKVNEVCVISASEMEAAQASGEIDAHPDAVAYAESLVPDAE